MFNNLTNRIIGGRLKISLGNFDYSSYINIINEEDKFTKIDDMKDFPFSFDTLYAFEGKDSYDLYYNRMQIHIIKTEDVSAMEIFLSEKDTPWYVNENTTASPDVAKFKVYTKGSEKLITGRFILDELYIEGSWNVYVKNTLTKIKNIINGYSESVRYDIIYKTAE